MKKNKIKCWILAWCDYDDSAWVSPRINPRLDKFDQMDSGFHFTSDGFKPTPNIIISKSRPRFD